MAKKKKISPPRDLDISLYRTKCSTYWGNKQVMLLGVDKIYGGKFKPRDLRRIAKWCNKAADWLGDKNG